MIEIIALFAVMCFGVAQHQNGVADAMIEALYLLACETQFFLSMRQQKAPANSTHVVQRNSRLHFPQTMSKFSCNTITSYRPPSIVCGLLRAESHSKSSLLDYSLSADIVNNSICHFLEFVSG